MSGFAFEPTALAGVADRLRATGSAVAGIVGSLPQAPDAGEMGAEIADLLGHLLTGAAELAAGVTAAGDAVAAGLGDYRGREDAVRQTVLGAG